jgi:hypothetical protein
MIKQLIAKWRRHRAICFAIHVAETGTVRNLECYEAVK